MLNGKITNWKKNLLKGTYFKWQSWQLGTKSTQDKIKLKKNINFIRKVVQILALNYYIFGLNFINFMEIDTGIFFCRRKQLCEIKMIAFKWWHL